LPSDKNDGGIIGNIPVVFGQGDINRKAIQVVSQDSQLLADNPDDFIPIEKSEYFLSLDEKQQKLLIGSNLFVSSEPVEIDESNATYQNFTNGMLNPEGLALINAMQQTGMIDEYGNINNQSVTLNYNPTHGFLGDFLESSTDTLPLWHTGIAKQTGEFVRDVTTARASQGSNFNNHSQGSTLFQSGLEYIKANGGFEDADYFEGNTPTVGVYGAAVNSKSMEETVNSVGFNFTGSRTHTDDFVGEAIGGNKENNEQADLVDRINIFNIPKLFTDDSPHSTYFCVELGKAQCDDQPTQ
jgi:filamentous hemagglutinin